MLELKIFSSLSKIFPDMEPDPAEEIDSGCALTGERYSFQVAAKSLNHSQSCAWVKIESDLGEAVSVRYVDYVPCDHTLPKEYQHLCQHPAPGLMPDILKPLPPYLWVYDYSFRTLWITVDTAHALATPGKHTVKVILSDDTENAAEFTLEILAAQLPEYQIPVTNWFHCDCLCNYYHVAFASDRFWEIAAAFMKTAVDNGINTLLTPIFTPPLDTAVGGERLTTQLVTVLANPDGTYSFDFSLLDRWISECRKAGAKYFEISHLYTQWGCAHAPKVMGYKNGEYTRLFGWETEGPGEEYSAFLRALLPELTGHLKELGVFDRCFFHVSDEPAYSMAETYGKGSKLVREFVPGSQIIDAMSEPKYWKDGMIDVPVASLSAIDRFIDAKIDDLWGYYCCGQLDTSNRFVSTPSYRNRVLGIQLFMNDIKGFLQWGFNFYNYHMSAAALDPYSSCTGGGWVPGGDPYVVYPGPDGKPVESIRLVVFYEALCDMRVLSALEEKGYTREQLKAELGIPDLPFIGFETDAKTLLRIREKANRMIQL